MIFPFMGYHLSVSSNFPLYFNSGLRDDTETTYVFPGVNISQLAEFVENIYTEFNGDSITKEERMSDCHDFENCAQCQTCDHCENCDLKQEMLRACEDFENCAECETCDHCENCDLKQELLRACQQL